MADYIEPEGIDEEVVQNEVTSDPIVKVKWNPIGEQKTLKKILQDLGIHDHIGLIWDTEEGVQFCVAMEDSTVVFNPGDTIGYNRNTCKFFKP